jgi:hypothetical protein
VYTLHRLDRLGDNVSVGFELSFDVFVSNCCPPRRPATPRRGRLDDRHKAVQDAIRDIRGARAAELIDPVLDRPPCGHLGIDRIGLHEYRFAQTWTPSGRWRCRVGSKIVENAPPMFGTLRRRWDWERGYRFAVTGACWQPMRVAVVSAPLDWAAGLLPPPFPWATTCRPDHAAAVTTARGRGAGRRGVSAPCARCRGGP